MYSVLLFPISALYGVLGLLLRILSAFLVPSIGELFFHMFTFCSFSPMSVFLSLPALPICHDGLFFRGSYMPNP
jgi:hypothetical protein